MAPEKPSFLHQIWNTTGIMQFKQPDPNYVHSQPYSTSNQYCFHQNDAQTIPLSQMEMNHMGQPRTNYEHTSIRSNYSHHTIPYASSVLYPQRWGASINFKIKLNLNTPFFSPEDESIYDQLPIRNYLWSVFNKRKNSERHCSCSYQV